MFKACIVTLLGISTLLLSISLPLTTEAVAHLLIPKLVQIELLKI